MSTELLSSMQRGKGLIAAAGSGDSKLPSTTEPLSKSRYRLAELAISAGLGRLVFTKRVANQVASIFTEIFESQKFRIERMELVDKFRGDDDASMAANNTSAFNCRFVAGTTALSAHALGIAIDINPEQNPFVKGAVTAPPKGKAFDRPSKRQSAQRRGQPGIIMPGDVVVKAFKRQGWKWGGDWSSKKDYQHFSENGR
jgi:hypothetical protein